MIIAWKSKLRKFCEWAGKTPDKLIAERKLEVKSENGKVQHSKEMLVKKFLKYLEEERDPTPNSRRVYFTAIRNFFQRNYLPFKFMRRESPPVARVLGGRLPSQESGKHSKPSDNSSGTFPPLS